MAMSIATCHEIFECWHGIHTLVHSWQSFFITGHTKLWLTCLVVALDLGWDGSCTTLNAACWEGLVI